ncbi:MAG TPA: DUF1592 domain-containing protein, partial [Vicinamibacterales bacterium]|nr:DUF1592 domain-containing protein [Vicinamibacterales bacterium]
MRAVTIILVFLNVFAGASHASGAGLPTDASQLVQVYCAGCHNGVMRSPSGALLDRFDPTAIAGNPDMWSRAYRQLQAGTMPPFGAPRPDRTAVGTLLSSIEIGLEANTPPLAAANSQQTAKRLAALLWNSAPDAALLADARRNRLTQPVTLE